MKWLLLSLAAVLLVVYLLEDRGHSTFPAGVLVPEEPAQSPLSGGPYWQKGKYRFSARADFSLRARILSAERYWLDGAAAVSPIDFAVGWGPMSDQRTIDQMGFGQTGRWWRYWPKGTQFPIPASEITSHSANMHMIPADDNVLKALRNVRRGDLVSLTGYLVDVESSSGWKWPTSLSRTDTGNGACEIVWVRRLVIQ